FHFSFIRTKLIPVTDNDGGGFIMKVFNLFLIIVFLFKSDLLKKQMNFSKKPRATNIIAVLTILATYIIYKASSTVFFYYNLKINPSQIIPLDIINTIMLAPVLEETLYRGIIINYLLPIRNNKIGYILLCFVFTSLLFSLMHNNFEFYYFMDNF